MQVPTLYKLVNIHGTSVTILDYGLTLTSFNVPVQGSSRNIVLGFKDPGFYLSGEYLSRNPYLGNIIGRYSNRIKGGSFVLNGTKYVLPQNDGENTLHGGISGFNQKWWNYIPELSHSQQAVFTIISKDKEEGFPGQIDITAIYRLDNDNSLHIEYKIFAHSDTVVNLTEHSYFNLNGNDSLVHDHYIRANVKAFLEQDMDLCPNGNLPSITKFSQDIRKPTLLQDLLPEGIDTTFVIDNADEDLFHAGTIQSADSQLHLEVWTDAPCLHIYSGAMLPELNEPNGISLRPFRGVCMECQGYTDAVHHPHFPSTLIKSEEFQSRRIIYHPKMTQ